MFLLADPEDKFLRDCEIVMMFMLVNSGDKVMRLYESVVVEITKLGVCRITSWAFAASSMYMLANPGDKDAHTAKHFCKTCRRYWTKEDA
ncbi:hypothetical protein V6N11_064285 [Hibiscus sabdariffa]|uniref:Uncharacterized protein n=1 Tax=Hibiscus sabdariffa TaxID=183260 RepID=A0ABR2PN58_9ROSI